MSEPKKGNRGPRIRTIKPEFWQDTKLMRTGDSGRLVLMCLISMADDEGRIEADHRTVANFAGWSDSAESFMDDGGPTEGKLGLGMNGVKVALDELEASGMIIQYEVSGNPYIQVNNFLKHQVINKATRSNKPAPPTPGTIPEQSRKAPVARPEVSRSAPVARQEHSRPDLDQEEVIGLRPNKNSDSQYGNRTRRTQPLVIEKIATSSLKHVNSMDVQAARNGAISVLATVPHSSPGEPVDAIDVDDGHLTSAPGSETIQ